MTDTPTDGTNSSCRPAAVAARPITATGYDTYVAAAARHDALEAELLPRNKSALFEALAKASIASVVVTFDGEGDSGQIEGVDAFRVDPERRAADASPAMVTAPLPSTLVILQSANLGSDTVDVCQTTVAEAIEDMAFTLLGTTQSGWDQQDGSFGEVTFDVATQTITLDFNERQMTSDFSQHIF